MVISNLHGIIAVVLFRLDNLICTNITYIELDNWNMIIYLILAVNNGKQFYL